MRLRLTIRSLHSSDYNAVKRIEGVTLDEYRRYLKRTGGTDIVPKGIRLEYFNHYIRMKSSFAATVDGVVVGYVLTQPLSSFDGGKRVLWLDCIAILPESRRRGIGSALMSKVESWGDKQGYPILYTSLNPNNAASRRLLKSMGFTLINWIKAVKEMSA